MLRQNTAIVRAVAHEDVSVGARLVTAIAKIPTGRDLHVDEPPRHGCDVCHGRRYIGVRQVLQHTLADDQIVLLSIAPARDIAMQKAVLLAHDLADLGPRVSDGFVVLLEPLLPEADAGPDVEHA